MVCLASPNPLYIVFFSKKILLSVCKSLKNLWINFPDPRHRGIWRKLTPINKPVTGSLRIGSSRTIYITRQTSVAYTGLRYWLNALSLINRLSNGGSYDFYKYSYCSNDDWFYVRQLSDGPGRRDQVPEKAGS